MQRKIWSKALLRMFEIIFRKLFRCNLKHFSTVKRRWWWSMLFITICNSYFSLSIHAKHLKTITKIAGGGVSYGASNELDTLWLRVSIGNCLVEKMFEIHWRALRKAKQRMNVRTRWNVYKNITSVRVCMGMRAIGGCALAPDELYRDGNSMDTGFIRFARRSKNTLYAKRNMALLEETKPSQTA